MKTDVDQQKENKRKEANRRRVAESKARKNAGRGCCTLEWDSAMLDAAVKAGYLSNFETDAKKIAVALGKLLREKTGNALACSRCGRRIIGA